MNQENKKQKYLAYLVHFYFWISKESFSENETFKNFSFNRNCFDHINH